MSITGQFDMPQDLVWIVQDFANTDGRILAVCATPEEAEEIAESFGAYSDDVRFAAFKVGYRFAQGT